MKIETTTGHFGIAVQGTIKTDQLETLAIAGLAQGELYRGVFAPAREYTGAKRKLEDSAPFTVEVGSRLESDVRKALAPFMDAGFMVNVSEYVGGEAGEAKPSKLACEQWLAIQQKSAEGFAKACKMIGLDHESDYTDEDGQKAVHRFLLDAKRAAEKAAAQSFE